MRLAEGIFRAMLALAIALGVMAIVADRWRR